MTSQPAALDLLEASPDAYVRFLFREHDDLTRYSLALAPEARQRELGAKATGALLRKRVREMLLRRGPLSPGASQALEQVDWFAIGLACLTGLLIEEPPPPSLPVPKAPLAGAALAAHRPAARVLPPLRLVPPPKEPEPQAAGSLALTTRPRGAMAEALDALAAEFVLPAVGGDATRPRPLSFAYVVALLVYFLLSRLTGEPRRETRGPR